MVSSSPHNGYRFGGYTLDVAGRQLLDPHGQPRPIGSRAFDTLCWCSARVIRCPRPT